MFRCKRCRQTFNDRHYLPTFALSCPLQTQLSRCGRVLLAPQLPVYIRNREGFGGRSFSSTLQIRTKRKGKVGKVWLIDKTFIRVKGVWCYLYRGIDGDGNLVDVRLSKTRDMVGTKAFFSQAIGLHEDVPEKVATRWFCFLSSGPR